MRVPPATVELDREQLGAGHVCERMRALNQDIIVRAEYRYSDFGSRSFDNDWADDSKIDLKTHDIRLGVAYKF